ncbi:hypothetical protein H2199_008791 [Coniosporium tulheliwenetii]|uniref:Uncharacterized protein n=1 Tax=Coniosporium tulheliwenetii TaxID=3383036 RepID=A0ACC2YHV5_9PEZI|nr:hypothetical protein H2199_008791 [Cladosporium sp. JES 115]
MPPKRKDTPSAGEDTAFDPSEPEAKRKKLGKRLAFPRFEDGDVVVSLGSAGEDNLVLYRRDLSRMCEYFENFDETGWPERFILQPSADVSECRVTPGELVSAIVTAGGVGGDFVRRNPCLLLEIACLLEDETIFVDALRHAAGRCPSLADEIRSVPADIARLVEDHANVLKRRVREVCCSLAVPPRTTLDLPTFIAWGFFHRYMVVSVFPRDPDSAEMFKSLAYLHGMRTGMELVETQQFGNILQSVDVIDRGLVQASNAVDLIHDDLREDHRQELDDLDKAFEETLNVKSVKTQLRQIVENAKLRLAPLFSGDKNADYFTFVNTVAPLYCES